MKQNKNIHVLPTDKPSRLYNCFSNLEIGEFVSTRDGLLVTNQNIYITSDEEIKEGDWVIANGGIRFVTSINNYKSKTFTDDGTISKQTPSLYCHLKHYKKIILTTDQELIKDGVQAIDDEFLEWFVKNPSCERIEVNGISDVALGGFADVYYKIIIPRTTQQIINEDYAGGLEMGQITAKEEAKQETLEEFIQKSYPKTDSHYDFTVTSKIRNGIRLGAKWQQEQDKNKYSEEEMLEFSEWVSHNDWVYLPSKGYWVNEEQEELEENFTTKELFKQFKKK